MSLCADVMTKMKEAMKAKDQNALTSLRAIKSALLLAQTETGSKEEISEEQELKMLQKLVKQRKDSAAIYLEQGREDIAAPELEQAIVIASFLPEQMSEEEIAKFVEDIIAKTRASSMADMGKVMGMARGQLAGKADGKIIYLLLKKN